ncbi:type IV secretory system conjugative DNA transfer family protein, partial [Acinetobacter nosocomialis]
TNGQSGITSSSAHGTPSSSGTSVTSKMEYIIEPEKFILLPIYTAVVSYNGTFGTLAMPKYWEVFNMPKRTKLKTVSDFKSLTSVD